MQPTELSIVIPVRGVEPALGPLLEVLSASGAELIVVAAEQSNGHRCPADVRWLECPIASRGHQLAMGTQAATRQWLWLLHADSQLSPGLLSQLWALQDPAWGRFDVQLDDDSAQLKLVANLMNWRSAKTGICTGDQGIFVHRSVLLAAGGMPAQPLMEDIELSRRLKRVSHCVRLPGPLVTSARRWQQQGIWATISCMWQLRLRYWLGADPQILAAKYYGSNSER